MCDDDHGHALGGEGAHGAEYLARQLGIECGGRLVKEHDVGLHGKRACDGNALLLSAGELARVVVLAIGEPDLREEFARVGENLILLHALDMAGRLDEVLDDGHVGKEVELLKNHACGHEDASYVRCTRIGRRGLAVFRPTEFFPADGNLPAINGFKFVDAAEQGGFAGAGGADDGEHLTAREAEVDAAQDAKRAKGFVNVAHGEHDLVSFRICHSAPPVS